VIRRLAARLRRTVVGDRRQQLVQDIERADQYLGMILYAARTMGAPETIDAATSRLFWQMWKIKVKAWAEEPES
jgi:hypothetical protein